MHMSTHVSTHVPMNMSMRMPIVISMDMSTQMSGMSPCHPMQSQRAWGATSTCQYTRLYTRVYAHVDNCRATVLAAALFIGRTPRR